jgi:hypothetical protein
MSEVATREEVTIKLSSYIDEFGGIQYNWDAIIEEAEQQIRKTTGRDVGVWMSE